jgi:SAM-dependent methyltransferase
MRQYCQPERFDVVINMFGSFGYFEQPGDNRKVACNMYSSLRPGGRFLIETNGKEIEARQFKSRNWFQYGDTFVLLERKIGDDWRRIFNRWIVIQDEKTIEHRVTIRSYAAHELSSLLTECGFANVRIYGSLEGIPYNNNAQRLVVIGYK